MGKNYYTTYLYANPSFLNGMARVLDFGASLQEYNESVTPKEADYNAILRDWMVVGEDINQAIDQYEQEEKKK